MANSLYLIKQSAVRGYDTFNQAVVCAPDEDTARRTHPCGDVDWHRGPYRRDDWAHDPSDVEVIYLGLADPATDVGVVCASFNAG